MHILIVNLFYPAVLGSCLVWIIAELNEYFHGRKDNFDIVRFSFGFSLVMFFCSSYLSIVEYNPENYSRALFFIDLLESLLMFISFGFLGIVSKKDKLNYCGLYISFIIILILQALWVDQSVGVENKSTILLVVWCINIFYFLGWLVVFLFKRMFNAERYFEGLHDRVKYFSVALIFLSAVLYISIRA